jgi:hypothetical protein
MNWTTRSSIVLAALAALGACGPFEKREKREEELVLRSYAVPEETARRMKQALSQVFYTGGSGANDAKFVARADVGPNGQLLVLGTASIHEGVRAMVAELGKTQPTAPQTVEITFWLVLGKRGEGPKDPALAEIQGTLDEVAKAEGPSQFSLFERLRVSALDGEHGETRGRSAVAEQRVTLVGPSAVGDIKVHAGKHHLETRLSFTPGQSIVLGESGYEPEGKPSGGDRDTTLYYVIRAAVRSVR